jgi:plasmid stability protein
MRMGQILLRNVDDRLIETLKRRAAAAGRSMEAEARDALARGAQLTPAEKKARLRALLAETEALKVPGVVQTPSEVLIREDRDSR